MNGKKAKKLRKEVYGDMSPRVKHYARMKNGQIVNAGLRYKYQKAKKEAGK